MIKNLVTFAGKLSATIAVAGKQPIFNINNMSKFLLAPMNRSLSISSKYSLESYSLNSSTLYNSSKGRFLKPYQTSNEQLRSLTKFSLIKGKRKTVKCVLKRFKRLNWGIWIRTRTGRHKKLFKKSAALKRRLKQHIFVNATQSWLLDSMVTNYWRKPKYYVDDPYEQYHKREEFFATRKKPIELKK